MKNKLLILIFSFIFTGPLQAAETYAEQGILSVCADPFMLPFSNTDGEGFENKIAELFAEKLDMELRYEYFPQRMGFIRNTLKNEDDGIYKCDLVINVPDSFELAATTEPYYATRYMLAYVKGGKLDGLDDSEKLREMVQANNIDMRFGLPDRGPAQLWLFYREMITHMIPYQGHPGDAKFHPGQQMMEDLVAGKIDATIVWGPTAGYYAKKLKDQAEIVLLPINDIDKQNAEAKYTYNMSMAVRYGNKEWKDKINQLLKDNKDDIDKILMDYGVPLAEIQETEKEDDD
ncbi:MAG: quinoprotein dehydrogenase-associated putative ABC transporter substrate-binding protein [Thiotrichales bacterium]|nr:quinoprotein dehydrogenase-associated putative ABC transporter substrate-binding protein [Thiotrichales bacterium]